MFNYREQNEHVISHNIGQSYTCNKRVTLADFMTTSDSSLANQIKVHPKTIREIEDEMWSHIV